MRDRMRKSMKGDQRYLDKKIYGFNNYRKNEILIAKTMKASIIFMVVSYFVVEAFSIATKFSKE